MANPVIDQYGNKFWYNSDGQIHRDDGPAVEDIGGGIRAWFINDTRHRDDGPAIDRDSGTKEWWIKGINITNEVNQWIIDNNFPIYEKWDDNIRVLFKLKFG